VGAMSNQLVQEKSCQRQSNNRFNIV